MLDTIIIGSGPAGLYAATLAGMHNLKACILESAYEYGGTLNLYKEKMVYDMPGYTKISAGELIENLFNQYRQYENEIPLYLNEKAISVERIEGGYILKTTKTTYKTKTILLANGGGVFEPRLLDLENALGKTNIYYNVKSVSDFKNQDLVVLGGGDSSVDWALTLNEVANSVTLIHRRNEFRAHERNVIKIKETGTVLTPYVPTDVIGYDKVEYLVIENTETKEQKEIKLDALFVFYGSQASKNTFEDWGLSYQNKLITVKSDMQTSLDNIYAVGNGVTYPGKRKMISTALGEAATAICAITQVLYPDKTLTHKH